MADDGSAGYGRVPRWVVERIDSIGIVGLGVYTVLADYCDANRFCRPSLRVLALRCGNASHRTIVAALDRLQKAECIRRLDDGGRYSWQLPMQPARSDATGAVAVASNESECYRSGSGTGAVAVPERYQKRYRSGSTTATGAVPPSEQEPRTRTMNKNQLRTWPYDEPPTGTPFHVLWRVESECKRIVVTADLPVELRHLKAMLQGFSEEDIAAMWMAALRGSKPEFGLPRFLVGKIGPWVAGRHTSPGNNGHKPVDHDALRAASDEVARSLGWTG